MSKEDLTDEEIEEMLEKDLKANEAKKDNCGTAIPPNREVGVQRNQVKMKKEE
ncbi:MAG: hypothetical protein BAJALOKI3v1_900019 [Promethearchaeota archaeon]|jgi:hypothetical protein|nr:MAG: hypothetical protein BAJALOKI3v1_900019 [Candidatus Lokiarchaeota archaeon]